MMEGFLDGTPTWTNVSGAEGEMLNSWLRAAAEAQHWQAEVPDGDADELPAGEQARVRRGRLHRMPTGQEKGDLLMILWSFFRLRR